MSPTVQIALLWLGFGASHVLLSSNALRPRIAGRIGERAFQGLYSLVALLFFVPLVSVYLGHRHEGPWLWTVTMTPLATWLVYAGMALAMTMLVAGIVSPSPTSMTAGGGPPEVRGMHRITRHPVVMSIGLLGLVHMVPNASLTDVVFFAGLPAFALVGARHQELRLRPRRGPEFAAYLDGTPFLPRSARGVLLGLRELPLHVWAFGIGLAAALRWLHGPLFH